MYNVNSPIVNNILGMGGNFIPPNPIGNINMGMGYNTNTMGGYYNNIYSNYQNPYLLAKQEEMRKVQEKEHQQQYSGIVKKLIRTANTSLGLQTNEEGLKQYDPVYIQGQDSEEAETLQLINTYYNGGYHNPKLIAQINANNKIYEKKKEAFPDTMGIYEFHEKAGELYFEAIMDQQKERQKDLSRLYNEDQYNKLLSKYKGTSYFDAICNRNGEGNKEVTLDDMEIKLPQHLSNEYEKRRQAFLTSILNK